MIQTARTIQQTISLVAESQREISRLRDGIEDTKAVVARSMDAIAESKKAMATAMRVMFGY